MSKIGWGLLGCLLLAFFFWRGEKPPCKLDQLIPAEIKEDPFYEAIYRLAKTEKIATILEIGSSSGEGSTEALVKGIRENPEMPTLFCLEVSRGRFRALQEQYRQDSFVHCYHASSVPAEAFPKEEEVIHFYETIPSRLNLTPLPTVLEWLRQDLAYLKEQKVPQRGIERIRKENGIDCFDLVLIDGSEFAGSSELDQVYGAHFILLDDTCTFKNFHNRERLLQDPAYELIEENPTVRNGYAIFRKLEVPPATDHEAS